MMVDRPPNPAEIVAYLRSRGWAVVDDGYQGRAAMWAIACDGERDEAEVLVPMSHDSPDFDRVFARLLKTVAQLEQRSSHQVASDIRETSVDAISYRVVLREEHSTSIPLSLSPLVFRSAYEATIAAANAASRVRSSYGTWTAEVREFAQRARVAQTEPGSYVVRILCPVTPLPGSQIRTDEEPPFDRRVTQTLHSALTAACDAAKRTITTTKISEFDSTIESGVSSNLCAALGLLSKGDHGSVSLDVGMKWADLPGLTIPSSGRIFFGPDTLEVLQTAASHLRTLEDEHYENTTVIGNITECQKEPKASVGSVTLRGVDFLSHGDEPRKIKVKMDLARDDYNVAAHAHSESGLVTVVGTVRHVGQRWWMENITSIRRIEFPSQDDSAR